MSSVVFELAGYEFTASVGDGIIINPNKLQLVDHKLPKNFITAMTFALGIFKNLEHILMIIDAGDAAIQQYLRSLDTANLVMLKDLEASPGAHHISLRFSEPLLSFLQATENEYRNRLSRSTTRQSTNTRGFVYLLQSPSSAYKIGRTRDPNNRLKTFGVQLPFEIEYIALIETQDMYWLEQSLHARFEARRINGEWFALDEFDIKYIKSLADREVQR